MNIETKLALLVGGITAVNACSTVSTVNSVRHYRDRTEMYLNESALSVVTNRLVPDIYKLSAKDDPKSAFFCVHFAANDDYAKQNPFWPTTATRALSSNLKYNRWFADYELEINVDRVAYGLTWINSTEIVTEYKVYGDICLSKK